jgi:hypothetical protein
MAELGSDDRDQLAARGIGIAEAERQLALLREPRRAFRLLRPCTVGDGVQRLASEQQEAAKAAWRQAARGGGAAKLVPASGAATRMFRTLLPLLDEERFPAAGEVARRAAAGDAGARDLDRLFRELHRLPFFDELAALAASRGTPLRELREGRDGRRLLQLLIGERGLGLAALPKALLPFHRYPSGSRTALEEHLREGAAYLTDGSGRCRFHFTVAPEARAAFEREADEARGRLLRDAGCHAEVELSEQHPRTDTLAITPAGAPFREDDGRLLLRPGGHGALLDNLGALDSRWVLLKNVDNVRPEPAHGLVGHWQEVLGGMLVTLESRAGEHLRRVRAEAGGEELAEAAHFLAEELHVPAASAWLERPPSELRRLLRDRLERPLRVVGVVENRGEPGGGPFWVIRANGETSPQVVERAEVGDDQAQLATFAAGTHFNPVQIAAGLRDADHRPYELARFVDEQAVFVARKSYQGRPLLALERPGLWNGAMAGWNTVFVEVPAETFAPVKTVFDLLRPEHQV